MLTERTPPLKQQQGIVLLLMLTLIIAAAATFLFTTVNPQQRKIERQQDTNQTMVRTRDELIGDALANGTKLICPDTDNDGLANDTNRDACNGQGSLPYKSLGIENVRDASGNVLSYELQQTGGLTVMGNGNYKAILTFNGIELGVPE
jgi:hypothetical protein